jgi:hypothetical protein
LAETSASSSKAEPVSKPRGSQIKDMQQEDYEVRQQQLRIKYGSNKTKQNYYSSRM